MPGLVSRAAGTKGVVLTDQQIKERCQVQLREASWKSGALRVPQSLSEAWWHSQGGKGGQAWGSGLKPSSEKLDCPAARSGLIPGPREPLKVIGHGCQDRIRAVLLQSASHT